MLCSSENANISHNCLKRSNPRRLGAALSHKPHITDDLEDLPLDTHDALPDTKITYRILQEGKNTPQKQKRYKTFVQLQQTYEKEQEKKWYRNGVRNQTNSGYA